MYACMLVCGDVTHNSRVACVNGFERVHMHQYTRSTLTALVLRFLVVQDKVNVLSYFETLCVDTNAANVLINSSLTILFIRMLRNARAPTLRIRLASVLGEGCANQQ